MITTEMLYNLMHVLLITNILAVLYSVLIPIGALLNTNYYYKSKKLDWDWIIHFFSVMSITFFIDGIKEHQSIREVLALDTLIIITSVITLVVVFLFFVLVKIYEYTAKKRGRM